MSIPAMRKIRPPCAGISVRITPESLSALLRNGCPFSSGVYTWGPTDVTPAHLEYTTWKEFNGEIHANFYSFKKMDRQ